VSQPQKSWEPLLYTKVTFREKLISSIVEEQKFLPAQYWNTVAVLVSKTNTYKLFDF
jgi:hypothetical protein